MKFLFLLLFIASPLIAGDGIIDGTDVMLIENDAYNFVTGNVKTDINGDGIVDGADLLIATELAANFITTQRPW